jgi:hypothetical protein
MEVSIASHPIATTFQTVVSSHLVARRKLTPLDAMTTEI